MPAGHPRDLRLGRYRGLRAEPPGPGPLWLGTFRHLTGYLAAHTSSGFLFADIKVSVCQRGERFLPDLSTFVAEPHAPGDNNA